MWCIVLTTLSFLGVVICATLLWQNSADNTSAEYHGFTHGMARYEFKPPVKIIRRERVFDWEQDDV